MKRPTTFDEMQRRSFERWDHMGAVPSHEAMHQLARVMVRRCLIGAAACLVAFAAAVWIDHAMTKAIGELIAAQDLGAQW